MGCMYVLYSMYCTGMDMHGYYPSSNYFLSLGYGSANKPLPLRISHIAIKRKTYYCTYHQLHLLTLPVWGKSTGSKLSPAVKLPRITAMTSRSSTPVARLLSQVASRLLRSSPAIPSRESPHTRVKQMEILYPTAIAMEEKKWYRQLFVIIITINRVSRIFNN